jgi:hypothetical protein
MPGRHPISKWGTKSRHAIHPLHFKPTTTKYPAKTALNHAYEMSKLNFTRKPISTNTGKRLNNGYRKQARLQTFIA